MLISCPNCNSVYNISDTRIPLKGKKFKCAECGEVWEVLPQDVKPVEPEGKTQNNYSADELKNENDDINVMFSRLSHNTKNLFNAENTVKPATAADNVRHFLGSFFTIYTAMAFLLVLCIILTAYLFYGYRYQIVADIPAMEKVYSRFDLESVYNGKDLIFRNVLIKELDYGSKYSVEISGRLYNNGKQAVRTLPVKVSLIDENGEVESEIIELLPTQLLAPKSSTLFRIVADNPSASVNKVRLSMEDITQN